MYTPAAVIVLAAGQGTRMKSSLPKVLHPMAGKTLLGHAIEAANSLAPKQLSVVIRHERQTVADHVTQIAPQAILADQDDIPGTGRAVECALNTLDEVNGVPIAGPIVVTSGDVPMLAAKTLQELLDAHMKAQAVVSVLTTRLGDATGYGRIIRDEAGILERIVEHRDATEKQRNIDEVNGGVYVFDADFLRNSLNRLDRSNDQGEVYLTDVIAAATNADRVRVAYCIADTWQLAGCNDRAQLAQLAQEMHRRINEKWMRTGVSIEDPATTLIEADVTIGVDTVIRPGCQLRGATTIGTNALIGPHTELIDTEVGDRAKLERVSANLAAVAHGATVGPWVELGPGTKIEAEAQVASFTSLKNVTVAAGEKSPELPVCK